MFQLMAKKGMLKLKNHNKMSTYKTHGTVKKFPFISGGTMGLMSRMFRLGRSTAHSIIDETCPAIHDVLREKYLAVSMDRFLSNI